MKKIIHCPDCNGGIRADGLALCNACRGRGAYVIYIGNGYRKPETPFCEECEDTCFVGDNGPGIFGNTEFLPCDCGQI